MLKTQALFASLSHPKPALVATLSSHHVAKSFTGTSIYTVSNSNNEFVLISDAKGSKSIGLLCFRQEDAEAFLTQVRSRKRELRGKDRVVPITLDQVNLEYLGRIVFNIDGILYPDSVIGTDSHTPMIDGLGVAGWGVGGIEAEAAMLGQVSAIESYLRANGLFVDCKEAHHERVYTSHLQLNLGEIESCVSGPKRPNDRVPLKDMKANWHACLDNKVRFKGFGISKGERVKVVKFSFQGHPAELKHRSVVIAAITSCTNTSNPSLMLGAGLVAKKACELGLEVKQWIKTRLAPGSRIVTEYLL